ncbi:dethiobiotin synthase [Pseudochryseolinea flava]|uniref:ATP-dependent dethiobiotin synthetase BioD n=1 Tax=Pseudochryseolinea flava TaxID=2059302 RepID=A0A364XWY5_9BACT|nr:dethiobiotin synthase [Pseudochryseolinea flava]RAV98272.1 dethiobiotin synthase [Pseudochryseolinea flava]
MNYFVTGIDTDSGKTLASAILCEALEADYWKPVQAGLPRDNQTVKNLITNTTTEIYPETYLLKAPASPHASAKKEGITIQLNEFKLPSSKNKNLVIEGAGGCLVPLNDKDVVIDLVKIFDAQVVLVADLYLGSINHTLLTVEALQNRNIKVKGIIFNGESNPESERIILLKSGLKCILRIDQERHIHPGIVKQYAKTLIAHWND